MFNATAPICTALIAWSWTGERPSASRLLGLVIGVAGVVGRAYVLYFRLIAHAGAANEMTVALLVPAFAIAWGWLFLGEVLGAGTLAGCAVVLPCTALSTGLLRLPAAACRST